MLLDFLKPPIKVYERVFVCQIKDNQNTVGTFIISFGDGSVPFLTSSVPNLKSYRWFINLKRSEPEVDTNCGDKIFLEFIVLKFSLKITYSEPDQ